MEDYGLGMGGTLCDESNLGRYIEQSPLFQLNRVSAPVLLIHGDADRVVPHYLSSEVFSALRRLGKPAVLALYPGEGHGAADWSAVHLEDRWNRVAAWWSRWLGGLE